MKHRDKQAPQSAEETVRDIRRATRRQHACRVVDANPSDAYDRQGRSNRDPLPEKHQCLTYINAGDMAKSMVSPRKGMSLLTLNYSQPRAPAPKA